MRPSTRRDAPHAVDTTTPVQPIRRRRARALTEASAASLPVAPLVFIVDPHEAEVRRLQRVLEQAEVARVRGFTSSVSAIEAISRSAPELVILALEMPRLDGVAFLDRLRARTAPGEFLPVLTMTADPASGGLERAASAGAIDFLTKPIKDWEIVARTRNLLRTRRLHVELRDRNRDLATAQISSQNALAESERQLAQAQRIAHLGSWEWDFATGMARRSLETHRIFGVLPGLLPATNEAFLALVHPADRTSVEESLRAAIAGEAEYDRDCRIVRLDGSVRTIHEVAEVMRDAAGRPTSMVGTVQDVTERRLEEAERARLVSAVEQTADPIWMRDLDGTVTYVNPAFTRAYGFTPEMIVGRNAALVDSGVHDPSFFTDVFASVANGATWSGTIVNRRADGVLLEVEATLSTVRDREGRLTGYVQADRDVTRERRLESALARDARERDTIEAALARIDRDSSAHDIAAAAIRELGRLGEIDSAWAIELSGGSGRILAAEGRIESAVHPGQVLPRGRATNLLERARSGPWTEEWRPRRGDGSFGHNIAGTGLHTVAFAPIRGASDVLGVIGIGAHDAAGAVGVVERLPALATFASIVSALVAPALEAERRAGNARARIEAMLSGEAWIPFFQPIADLRTGAILGYEALTRFADGRPTRLVFDEAERAGLGLDLEAATARSALAAARALPPRAYLSVNASPALIASGLLRSLTRGVERQVVLEITEHVAIDDYAALRAAVVSLGRHVRVAVDDAGAGYASMRHILELAPDTVKLDTGLVRGIDRDPARQALVAGMAYFGVKRNIHLVAEGIETAAELEALRALGIPQGQGFLLGRPQDAPAEGQWPTRIEASVIADPRRRGAGGAAPGGAAAAGAAPGGAPASAPSGAPVAVRAE